MTCFITLKCWTDDDNVVQMFVALFSIKSNKVKFPHFVGPVNMTLCGSLI